jgi:hypothetical protein
VTRSEVYVHSGWEPEDAVRTFYEIPDRIVEMVRSAGVVEGETFASCLHNLALEREAALSRDQAAQARGEDVIRMDCPSCGEGLQCVLCGADIPEPMRAVNRAEQYEALIREMLRDEPVRRRWENRALALVDHHVGQ